MSKVEALYFRGMNSETDENDMWNDSQLVKAYEKAMKSYRPVDMAKRIAMATNAKAGEKSDGKDRVWRVGDACRAIYEEDGEYYEAYIVEILDKARCIVKFVGYGNDETVKLKELKPSHGVAARSEQVYNITTEPTWKEILRKDKQCELNSASSDLNEEETSSAAVKDTGHDSTVQSDRQSEQGHKKKKKRRTNHKRKAQADVSQDDVFLHPDRLSMHLNPMNTFPVDMAGLTQMPPLPPLLPLGDGDEDEHELLNNMLTAWYMSGYYAGLYQNRLKKKSKN